MYVYSTFYTQICYIFIKDMIAKVWASHCVMHIHVHDVVCTIFFVKDIILHGWLNCDVAIKWRVIGNGNMQ